ncbi:hypothetical protein [Paenibacillus sp. FSL R10-2736]
MDKTIQYRAAEEQCGSTEDQQKTNRRTIEEQQNTNRIPAEDQREDQ